MSIDTVLKKRKQDELEKKAAERDAFISRIKKVISQPYDNINKPVPLFKQLRSGK